jgi:hypothetical protein
MGIDIYMRWDGITEQEKQSQLTGFSVTSGHLGYLREAYHGGPYATKKLVPEAFEAEDAGYEAQISAELMRARLPEVIETCLHREQHVYGKTNVTKDSPIALAFVQFVELAEKQEAATGIPVTVRASF